MDFRVKNLDYPTIICIPFVSQISPMDFRVKHLDYSIIMHNILGR